MSANSHYLEDDEPSDLGVRCRESGMAVAGLSLVVSSPHRCANPWRVQLTPSRGRCRRPRTMESMRSQVFAGVAGRRGARRPRNRGGWGRLSPVPASCTRGPRDRAEPEDAGRRPKRPTCAAARPSRSSETVRERIGRDSSGRPAVLARPAADTPMLSPKDRRGAARATNSSFSGVRPRSRRRITRHRTSVQRVRRVQI